jgi:hypothetical protein
VNGGKLRSIFKDGERAFSFLMIDWNWGKRQRKGREEAETKCFSFSFPFKHLFGLWPLSTQPNFHKWMYLFSSSCPSLPFPSFSSQGVGSQTQICLWEIMATFQGLNPPMTQPTKYHSHNIIYKF